MKAVTIKAIKAIIVPTWKALSFGYRKGTTKTERIIKGSIRISQKDSG
jgi:hypothetical protein